jgi:polyadenylate-binding protein
LGYAYVNYHNTQDAERALESMNFGEIKGRPCRIMWSQRDPSVRRSGVGNIFVKNLHEGIDNKQLYDTFSLFGNILSCKVVTDKETGMSKGYGYVHYETAEAAKQAIEKLDGMLIDGREVQVGVFMRRETRPGGKEGEWTNVFVKNLPYEWDDDKLKSEFEKFGEIISASISQGTRKKYPKKKHAPAKEANGEGAKEGEEAKEEGDVPEGEKKEDVNETKEPGKIDSAVVTDDEGEKKESDQPQEIHGSLGFGFVNFATHEAALAAVTEMNEKDFTVTEDGETITKAIYVGRAQKKAERERELRAKYEAEKIDRIAKFQGVNLYVKNLDDSVTDDTLRDEFSAMGTITSARVMRDLKTGVSRGFGFVCYSTPEDATRAVNEMNGKIVCGKPIFVALAQRRDVRRAQLEAAHNQGRGGGPGGQGMMRPMGGPMGGQFPGAVPMPMYRPGPGGMQPSYPMGPGMMVQGGRGGYNMPPGQPRPGYPGMPGGYGMMPAQPGRTGRGGPMGRGRGPLPARGAPQGRGPMPGRVPANAGIKFNQQARNAQGGPGMAPPPQQAPQPAAPQPAPANEQLTPAALASASPEMQKNMIGERLYPLIHQTQPELAGKITGMLLEMDNSELLHLLESPEALNAKIQEALQVLEAHNAQNK